MPRSAPRPLLGALTIVVGLSLATTSCNGDDDDDDSDDASQGACIDPLPLDCQPSFEPATYDEIFANVLRPSCGSSATGTQCHGAAGKQGGLTLADRDDAYDALLAPDVGPPRVVPGAPECSMLIQRLEADDPSVRMPLGTEPLDEGQRCAVRQWIANGAEP
jgi:hypothetical protein